MRYLLLIIFLFVLASGYSSREYDDRDGILHDVQLSNAYSKAFFSTVSLQIPEGTQTNNDEEVSGRNEQLRWLGIGLMIILVPGSVFVYIYFYRRYGTRHKADVSLRKLRYTTPDDTPPALVRSLMLGPLSSEPDRLALGLTIFDLARRGYYRIVEKSGDKKFLGSEIPLYKLEKTGKKPDDSLASWERMLWEKVTDRIDEGVTRMDKILALTTRSGKKWWKQWRKDFRRAIRETGWFDPSGKQVMFFHAAAQFPFLLGSIAVLLLAGTVGIIALVITTIMMGLTLTLYRYTRSGVDAWSVWSGYRKALKKGPASSFNQEEIGRHFVHAMALGLSRKQLEKCLAETSSDNSLFVWIVPMGGTYQKSDIASGLARMATSGTRSFSGLAGISSSSEKPESRHPVDPSAD